MKLNEIVLRILTGVIFSSFALIPAALFLSCASRTAVIIDSSSLQTQVEKIKLVHGGSSLLIREGMGTREIPLKRIRWIKISPREVYNEDGKTFYLCEIELTDGTKIMSYRLKDGRRSQAFVCIDDYLTAETHNGHVKLKLSDLSKITFE